VSPFVDNKIKKAKLAFLDKKTKDRVNKKTNGAIQAMLLEYLNDVESQRTIASLALEIDERLTRIKKEAESLEYQELTDQLFHFQVASLCVAVAQFKLHIDEAEKGVERFIENSFGKWRTYFTLQQDLLRLISIFSPQNMTKGIECLNRVPKLEQCSNFNVIKINAHSIDIQCVNKALVIPTGSATRPTPIQEPHALEVLEPGSARDTLLLKVNATIEMFQTNQRKIRVYQRHYVMLGNKEQLKEARRSLEETLDEVLYCIENMLSELHLECCIIKEVTGIKACFDEMLAILEKECQNCKEYAFNTINRFIECTTSYNKLQSYLRLHKIEPDQGISSIM